ncbi:hypothetical protein [Streptomyces flavidovirens]|uniref:hypothetical protein n=1 Tax=Streptomyces flavidovirens TaxID=67298 RepID=UPI0036C9E76F
MSLRLIVSAPSAQPSTDAAYRADLVTRYASAVDPFVQLAIFAEAIRYDEHNPGPYPLADELYGARLGDVA